MTTATEMRDAYQAAELDILQHGQSSRIGDRMLTTADLPQIIAGRKEWESRAKAEAYATLGRRAGYAIGRLDDA